MARFDANNLTRGQIVFVGMGFVVFVIVFAGLLAWSDPKNPSFHDEITIVRNCQSLAESQFGGPVSVNMDGLHNISADGSSWYQGFDAKTLNGFDIPVNYRGVCVADSDGSGGAKYHISMLKKVVQ